MSEFAGPEIAGLSIAAILHFAIAIPLCGHILLTKEQESSAIAWIGVVLLSPFVGPAAYGLLGINRIARRARRLQKSRSRRAERKAQAAEGGAPLLPEEQLVHLGRALQSMPLLPGNRIVPLVNGEGAYPPMLAAIESAKISVILSSYIFDYDAAGIRFMAALIAAHKRGVAVRVLLDDFGELYSRRSVDRELRAAGVPTARFMSDRLRNLLFLNLRNHRKIMVVDGRIGFIGGMNIRHGNCLAEKPKHPVRDIHFQAEGPIIDQMNAVFESDWTFASQEDLRLPAWQSPAADGEGRLLPTVASSTVARVVTAGPDQEIERVQWLLMGALSVARHRVVVMTPYFLPNDALASALAIAAMRGVDVDLVLPERCNILPVGWAAAAKWAPLVAHGVKVTLTAPPFDHSKVMVVDGAWVLVGSTNWDPRSLRLNFEADLEAYDPALGAELERYVAVRRESGRLVSRREVAATSLPVRLRNNFFRLFAPYL